MKYTIIIIQLLLISCQPDIICIENNGTYTSDSTKLLDENRLISISIGDRVSPMPSSSQLLTINGEEMYSILDENKLYIYNIDADSLTQTIDLSSFGTLNNYSGFTIVNMDSIFVYNYNKKTLYLTDNTAQQLNSWDIADPDGYVDVEATSESPILYHYPYVVMSGSRIGHPDDKYGKDFHISAVLDLSNNIVSYKWRYPDSYSKGNFGGLYMNKIYQTINEKGDIVLSFPISHEIIELQCNSDNERDIYLGSRYTKSIQSSDLNAIKEFWDKNKRIKYYTEQHSYANILYDKYRDVYYRIVRHPLKDWNGGTFIKPISIITMSGKGELLSETAVISSSNDLIYHNIHISKKGLLIQKNTRDENKVVFKVFSLHNE